MVCADGQKTHTGVLPSTPYRDSSRVEDARPLAPSPWDSSEGPTHLNSLPNNLPASLSEVTFPRHSLSSAKVLRQVDRKYVACVVDTPGSERSTHPTVILIDQHAADERVSVEGILESLCSGFLNGDVERTLLREPLPRITLSLQDAGDFSRPDVFAVLQRWGIDFVPSTQEAMESTLDWECFDVRSVPTALLSRLGRKGGEEMTRLIQGYLIELQDVMGELMNLLREAEAATVDWGRAMRFVPKEMLELANSKACRGS